MTDEELYPYIWEQLSDLGDCGPTDRCMLIMPEDVDAAQFDKVLAQVEQDMADERLAE